MGTSDARRGRPTRFRCVENLEWHLRARCRGLPTEIFFEYDGERGAGRAAREEYAKQVCRMCSVRRECLRYAVDSDEPYGIWGAMSARERARMGGDAWSTTEGEPVIS